jgi:hypothetical protein
MSYNVKNSWTNKLTIYWYMIKLLNYVDEMLVCASKCWWMIDNFLVNFKKGVVSQYLNKLKIMLVYVHEMLDDKKK